MCTCMYVYVCVCVYMYVCRYKEYVGRRKEGPAGRGAYVCVHVCMYVCTCV